MNQFFQHCIGALSAVTLTANVVHAEAMGITDGLALEFLSQWENVVLEVPHQRIAYVTHVMGQPVAQGGVAAGRLQFLTTQIDAYIGCDLASVLPTNAPNALPTVLFYEMAGDCPPRNAAQQSVMDVMIRLHEIVPDGDDAIVLTTLGGLNIQAAWE